MKNSNLGRSLLFSVTLVIGMTACTKKDRDVSQELVRPLSDSETILEFNGGKITAGDVRERMVPHFQKARELLLNEYLRAANQVLVERKSDPKGDAEIAISDFELASYMKANRIPEGEKEKIRSFLVGEKQRLANEEKRRTLFETMNVRNKLGAARFDVESTSTMPQFGPADAKVTVQLFCDFANPMCNRARMLMASTRSQFGDKLRWVYRFFPVASNVGGFEAANAAICAHDQGLFWLAHDRLLDLGPTLAKKDLTEVLGQIEKLDVQKLKICLRSEETKKHLDEEIKAATNLGLTSTPAYFVNGTKVDDADQVAAAIQAQLSK